MIYDAEAYSYGDVNERCEKLSLTAEDDRDVEVLNTLWREIKQHGMFRVQLIEPDAESDPRQADVT